MSAFDNIVNAVRGFQQRAEDAKIKNAMTNYLNDPAAAIQAVTAINPLRGVALQQQTQDRQAALAKQAQETQDAAAKRHMTAISGMAQALGRVRDKGGDLGAAFDQMTPMFKNGFQMDDGEIAQWKQAIMADPTIIDGLGAEAKKYIVGSPGSGIIDPTTGTIKDTVPNRPQYLQVPNATGGRDVLEVGGTGGATRGAGTNPIDDLGELIPGAVFTSGRRTPGGNAAVGGVGDSSHLDGHGVDIVPGRSGRTLDQIAAAVRQAGGVPLIEDDHVHAKFPAANIPYIGTTGSEGRGPPTITAGSPSGAPERGGGTRPIYSTQGKPPEEKGWVTMTPDEVKAAGLDPTKVYQKGVGGANTGKIQIVGGQSAAGKSAGLSPEMAQGMLGIYENLRDHARELLKHPSFDQATGSISGAMPSIFPGSVDFDAKLKAFRDQGALSAITELKSMSKTGANPLGQASNADATRFENYRGSLSQRAPETLKSTLRKYEIDSMIGIGRTIGVPEGAVKMLVQRPALAKDFDAKYGAGSARKILGE